MPIPSRIISLRIDLRKSYFLADAVVVGAEPA